MMNRGGRAGARLVCSVGFSIVAALCAIVVPLGNHPANMAAEARTAPLDAKMAVPPSGATVSAITQGLYIGSMTTRVTIVNRFLVPVGEEIRTYDAFVAVGPPMRSRDGSLVERNPFSLVIARYPFQGQGTVVDVAEASIWSSLSFNDLVGGGGTLFQYWTYQQSGDDFSGVLTDSHRREALALNLVNTIAEVGPNNWTLCTGNMIDIGDAFANITGATIQGRSTGDRVQIQVSGYVSACGISIAPFISTIDATLTSQPGPQPTAPANDLFGSARVITIPQGRETADTRGATVEPGEPAPSCIQSGGKTVWYSLTVPGGGPVTIKTAGSSFDTFVGVYTGDSLDSLRQVTCNDDTTPGTDVSSTVTFTSQPNVPYRIQVGGHGGESGDLVVDVTGPTTAPASFQLSVTRNGSGTGTVTSQPAGINCGTACTGSFTSGTPVTLTAIAAAGSEFAGWGGACSGSAACVVSMTSAQAVTATFSRAASTPTVSLTVTKRGAGVGTVTSSPAGIACGDDCSELFSEGSSATLTATAAAGSTFAGWSGACIGSGPCQLTLDAAKTVTATFDRASVGVQVGRPPGVSPSSGPILVATLTSRPGCGAVDHIQFGESGRHFDNARVTISSPAGGPADQDTAFTYTPPSGTMSVSLSIQRRVQSGGATVGPILFYDGCGEWPTFVGGGADAFR